MVVTSEHDVNNMSTRDKMTKQKRNRSKPRALDPEDEEPLSPESSDVRMQTKTHFDQLLKQAVEESNVPNKSGKKKKTDDTVLEKLRKGEGLVKDEDHTLLANVFNPDDGKRKKSNKQRQLEREKHSDEMIGQYNLTFEDEDESLGGKNKKKTKAIIEENDTIKELPSPKKKQGKKNKNTEAAGYSIPASPPAQTEEEAEHLKPTPRKKKKKLKTPDIEEQVVSDKHERSTENLVHSKDVSETVDEENDTIMVKKKKKKKDKKKGPRTEERGEAQETEIATSQPEEEEEEGEPKVIEDEGRVVAVIVHRTDKLKTDFYIAHPLVRVHVVDMDTGVHLKKQFSDRAVTSYYERDNQNVDFILPIMTFPYDFKQNKSVMPVWEETVVFNENFNYVIKDQTKAVIFFELLDFVSMNTASVKYNVVKQEGGWHRIAWAFLKVVGSTGKPNTDKKIRLQLYQPPVRYRPKDGQLEVFQWWKSCHRVTYPSTLYVTVKGLVLPTQVEPAGRSLFATQAEQGRKTFDELQRTLDDGTAKRRDSHAHHNPSLWSRLPGQACKVPNSLMLTLPITRKGCFCVKFSHDGRSLACACRDKDSFPVMVYEIPSGKLKGQLHGHYSITYDLNWSRNDKLLLSASSDGTARVWDAHHMVSTPVKLMPHPSYVYAAQFHTRVARVIVTGSYDRIVRVWSIQGDEVHAELMQELDGHLGFVNTLCFDDEGSKLFSGDSVGQIRIWNVYCTDQPSKRGVLKDWTLNKELNEAEMRGVSINYISLHPNGRRLLVHCRDNILRMFDLRINAIMQRYHGALNFREQIRSRITPCGSFIFAGSEDCTVYVWSAETGDRVAAYKDLGYKSPVTDVDFHPHDHIAVFCSFGDNHPVLVYKYNHSVAQRDAGIETPIRIVSPRQKGRAASPEMWPGSPKETDDEGLDTRTLQTSNRKDLNTLARLERAHHKLQAVTTLYRSGRPISPVHHPLGIPQTTTTMFDSTYGTNYDSTAWYSQLTSDMDTMAFKWTEQGDTGLPPSAFSPHAGKTLAESTLQQQLTSESQYQSSGWRPGFSSLGPQGNLLRPGSSQYSRGPNIGVNMLEGKLRFTFQGSDKPQSKHEEEQVVALYDYQAQRSDELSLVRGDAVRVLYKDNDNWWMGELVNGQQGFFPANYVTGQSDVSKAESDEDLLGQYMTKETRIDMDDDDDDDVTKYKKRMTALVSRTGQLKIFSGTEESDADVTTPKKVKRKKKTQPEVNTMKSTDSTPTTPKKTTVKKKKKRTTIKDESEA